MTLADFTESELVLPQLESVDAAGAIQELSRALQRARKIEDLLPFYHAALNRELLVSTNIEAGMAFPHARLPGVKGLAFALGRSRTPIAWRTKGSLSVSLVFLCAVPATDPIQYLGLLSGFARLARQPALVGELLAAGDVHAMLDLLARVPLKLLEAA